MLLDEVKKIIYDREASYGSVDYNFKKIANYWSEYLGIKLNENNVAIMMILLKIAREQCGHKRDNLIDIAGYVECLDNLNRGR